MNAVRAISIRQPWAWSITHLQKNIENRTWRTKFRGPVLIHAGAGVKASDIGDFMAAVGGDPDLLARLDAAGGLRLDDLRAQAGGIVGAVEITGCVTSSSSPWFFGPFGFVLASAKPLPFLPCKGALGFFAPDLPDVDAVARAAAIPDRFTTPPLFSRFPSWPPEPRERAMGRAAPPAEDRQLRLI